MNGTIFGIGPLEVLVVGILILLVFGPERLPEFTRGIGTALRRLRETYIGFTQEFRGELEPIAQDIESVTREIRQEVDAIREAADIRTIIKPYTDDVNKALALKDIAAAPQKVYTQADIIAMNTPASNTANGAAHSAAPSTNGAVSAAPSKTASANGSQKPDAARKPVMQSVASSPLLGDVKLTEDNPWANVGAQVRSDKLDDDNPWRL